MSGCFDLLTQSDRRATGSLTVVWLTGLVGSGLVGSGLVDWLTDWLGGWLVDLDRWLVLM